MLTRRATTLPALLATALLLLGACGTSEGMEGDSEPTSAGGQEKVTVTDARGKKVTLPRPAKRVVALEWAEAEMLLSLDANLVGIADPDGFRTWNSAEPLGKGVKDVGMRAEASVDSIVGLEPDLVVLEEERGSPLVRQLEKYVPVIVTEGSDSKRNLERMREDFTMIGKAVGAEDKAQQVLDDFDADLEEAEKRLSDAGATGEKFAMADGWQSGSNISIRMFGKGSLTSDVAEEVGLENAWTGKADPKWGLTTTDVEGLMPLKKEKDLTFIYSASETDVFAKGLSDNAIWQSMPFVKQDNLHKLDDGTWTFGGPAAMSMFLEQLLEVYDA